MLSDPEVHLVFVSNSSSWRGTPTQIEDTMPFNFQCTMVYYAAIFMKIAAPATQTFVHRRHQPELQAKVWTLAVKNLKASTCIIFAWVFLFAKKRLGNINFYGSGKHPAFALRPIKTRQAMCLFLSKGMTYSLTSRKFGSFSRFGQVLVVCILRNITKLPMVRNIPWETFGVCSLTRGR